MKLHTLTALTLLLTLATSAQAYKIGGDVRQVASVDTVTTSSLGSDTYARTVLNTVYDGADIGGSVHQTLSADNILTTAVGSKATACTSINVVGERDCARR